MEAKDLPITNQSIRLIPESVTQLPDNIVPPGISQFSEKIVPDPRQRYGFILQANGRDTRSFSGATVYIPIPGKNDLLDMIYVWGDVKDGANGFFSGASNTIFISKDAWINLAHDSVSVMRQGIENVHSSWTDILRQQSDGLLRLYSEINAGKTELHEINHRIHWSLTQPDQIRLHTDFIRDIASDSMLANAMGQFITHLYQNRAPGNYLDIHRQEAGKVRLYRDAYWRTAGITDPRTINIDTGMEKINVSLAWLLTETYAYLSPYVLLDRMCETNVPFAVELQNLLQNAPKETVNPMSQSLRSLYALIKKNPFGAHDLPTLYPSEIVDIFHNYRDSRQSAVDFLIQINSMTPLSDPVDLKHNPAHSKAIQTEFTNNTY